MKNKKYRITGEYTLGYRRIEKGNILVRRRAVPRAITNDPSDFVSLFESVQDILFYIIKREYAVKEDWIILEEKKITVIEKVIKGATIFKTDYWYEEVEQHE